MSDTNLHEKPFTPEELERIKQYWMEPPKECLGKCDIVDGCVVSWCSGCGWDDAPVGMG